MLIVLRGMFLAVPTEANHPKGLFIIIGHREINICADLTLLKHASNSTNSWFNLSVN